MNANMNTTLLNDKETFIYFDINDESVEDNFIDDIKKDLFNDPTNVKFGIINLKTNCFDLNSSVTHSSSKKKHHFVFDIDCSGSMNDICNDGKTKMDHIIHTLINMVSYFAESNGLVVYVTVFAFDDIIYNIIENELVSQENLEKLIQQIKTIRSKNQTNIEKALINSTEYIQKIIQSQYDERDVVVSVGEKINYTRIFMTDGDANQGSCDVMELKKIFCNNLLVTNFFIGFGIDHNAYLLKGLGSGNKNNYYFVDALEKAGLVYGEILHTVIYKISENVVLNITNGYVYDWKKNIWVDNIEIDDLVSDTNKVLHIISENPDECSCLVKGINCLTGNQFEYNITRLHIVPETDDGEKIKNINLEIYKYRQKTQQLLFLINKYNFDKNSYLLNDSTFKNNCMLRLIDLDDYDKNYKESNDYSFNLKNKMKGLLDELVTFEKLQTDPDDKKMIKMLCDDVYICLQTFDTRYGAMFSCARQVSQGEQRSYSATCTQHLKRSVAVHNWSHSLRSPSIIYDNVLFQDENIENIENTAFHNQDEENISFDPANFYKLNSSRSDEDLSDNTYTVLEQTDNPYCNPSVLSLMRSCSANVNDNKLFR